MKERYGIIDIGSNTMRLVIYEKGPNGLYRELENIKVAARLRTYLEDGVLTAAGIAVLLAALQQFHEITRYHQLPAQSVSCIATATVRQAANQEYIRRLVKEETDFQLRIISEYEEAYYGYVAIINSAPFTEGVTVDMGGGSTEITYFRDRQLMEYRSFPFGSLSLRQQFVKGAVPTEAERDAISAYVTRQLHTLPWLKQRRVPVIAIGGSARSMARVQQNMTQYPISGLHLYEMSRQDVESVQAYMVSMSLAELQKLDGLAKDRADTVIPAMEAFRALMQVTAAPSCIVSRKGLREGVFYEELLKPLGLPYYPNPAEESLHALAAAYEIDMNSVVQLIRNASAICQGLQQSGTASFAEEDLQAVRRAAKVFNLGRYIDEEASSQHTFYILANKTIEGLLHKERLKLALLASYKTKVSFKQYIAPFERWFSKEEQRMIRLLGAVLQLAAALDTTNRRLVQDITVARAGEDLVLYVWCSYDSLVEQVQAEKQKRQLEKLLKRNIELQFLVKV